MDIFPHNFNTFVTISVLYIVLSNFGYDFSVIGVFTKLIAVDSLFVGLSFLGWKVGCLIKSTGVRYYCFFLVCCFLLLINALTWWKFSGFVGFLAVFAGIPWIFLELYEFVDYFTNLIVIYHENVSRFCEFVFYSIFATFANYLAKTAGIAITLEWKYMRAKMMCVEKSQMKNTFGAILRGFVVAKIGVPVWMPPRVVKSACCAIVEGIFGADEEPQRKNRFERSEIDLKMVTLARNELKTGNYGILRKLIASDSWDIITHGEIIPYAVEFIVQSLAKNTNNDMQVILNKAKSAIYKYLAVYSIIYVVNIPGVSLVIFCVLFLTSHNNEQRDGVCSLRFVLFLLSWFIGFYLQGEQLAAIAGFVGWFLGSSFFRWALNIIGGFLYRKIHDFYFGFSTVSKEYNNPKILELKYIRPTIDNIVIEYFSALAVVYICGNLILLLFLHPFVFKHSLLVMLLSMLGLLSSYNFVHLALITLIVYFVVRRKKPENIGLKVINEYVDNVNYESCENCKNYENCKNHENCKNYENCKKQTEDKPSVIIEEIPVNKNVILANATLPESQQNNLFNCDVGKNTGKNTEKNTLIFTIDDYVGSPTIVKTQIMM